MKPAEHHRVCDECFMTKKLDAKHFPKIRFKTETVRGRKSVRKYFSHICIDCTEMIENKQNNIVRRDIKIFDKNIRLHPFNIMIAKLHINV